MTVEMQSSTAAGTGVFGPEDMLHQLDELMALPGAQGHHYLVVRQLLVEGRSIQNYSLQELQKFTGKSASTCKVIRRFVQDFALRISAQGQDSDPCVHGISTCVQHVQYNIHEAETRPLTQQLLDLGWGQKKGRQVQDPEELMQTHGIDRVRQALHGATQPDVRNPAGFITWFLRQPASQPASKAETISDSAPTQRSPAPDTPQELLPVLAWLRGEVRPQTWKSWFEDCRLTRADDGVVVWLANPYVKHFVRDKFGPLLQTAVEQNIGSGLRLSFEDYE
ncbi:MAG: hypothetical protein O2782_18660 [bacterium]|nr:hypothetical protein [bacterium]